MHVHFHVIPRVAGDGLIKHPGPHDGMLGADAGKEMAEKIKASL